MTHEEAKRAKYLLEKITDQEHYRSKFENFAITLEKESVDLIEISLKPNKGDAPFVVLAPKNYVSNMMKDFAGEATSVIERYNQQLEEL